MATKELSKDSQLRRRRIAAGMCSRCGKREIDSERSISKCSACLGELVAWNASRKAGVVATIKPHAKPKTKPKTKPKAKPKRSRVKK